MGLKSRIGHLIGGRPTSEALAGYGTELRALQEKLAQTDVELQALRNQVREAVDDLGDRIGSLAERLNSTP
jgi:ABC-type transporter Mla subunit MlaD